MVKIVVIDRQSAFSDCLKTILLTQDDFEIAGVGKDTYDALTLVEKHKPDVALIEFEMPSVDMAKLYSSIQGRSGQTHVAFVTRETSDSAVTLLAKAHVGGTIDRENAVHEVVAACRALSSGETYITHTMAVRSFELFSEYMRNAKQNARNTQGFLPAPDQPFYLNHAESKVAFQVSRGLSNREIAAALSLREGTVRNYVSAILKKTGLQHRTQIALHAMSGAFIDKSAHPPADAAGVFASRVRAPAARMAASYSRAV